MIVRLKFIHNKNHCKIFTIKHFNLVYIHFYKKLVVYYTYVSLTQYFYIYANEYIRSQVPR